jgi:hypothetical protein
MDPVTRYSRLLAAILLALAIPSRGMSAEPATARFGIMALPFSGIVVPHQNIAKYNPAPPLGLGAEVYYKPYFSFTGDVQLSWHNGTGDSDLKLTTLRIMGRWRWPLARWTPFAQGGFGLYQVETGNERENQGDQSFGGAGLIVGGGAEVPLWKELYAQGDVRSNWVRVEESGGGREKWAGHTEVLLWFVYKLP